MQNALKTLSPNLEGRDFVIGDLHGAYPALLNLFKGINFDPEKDRLMSVTDLVDRGPDSLSCLRLLREKFFHGAIANHEQMMYEAFHGGYMGNFWLRNGGSWGAPALQAFKARARDSSFIVDDEHAEIIDLVDMIGELPFMITVNHKNGKKFHILHAEIPSHLAGRVTDKDLEDDTIVRELATTEAPDGGDSFVWGRRIFLPFYGIPLTKEKVVKDLKHRKILNCFNDERSMVISGHTIMTQPLTIVGQTNIDTCAQASCRNPAVEPWAALTCIELDTWTFYQATPTSFKVVEPLTVNKEDLI
ncbi:metallophosphoesterase [Acinetobacter sp.]|uniref:metallophosphoesterase n=1 Tax=Acinetobacter sp. TaxID=472 RepID=UPI00388E92E6